MPSNVIEPFHVNEERAIAWYIATDIDHAREQYLHFVDDFSHQGISEGEDQWDTVHEEAELADQEFPLIIAFYLNFDHADRHEALVAPLGNAISVTPPELIAHYQLTQ